MSTDNHQIEDVSDAFDSVYADYAGASLSALATILLPLSEKIKMNEARHELFTDDPMNYFLQTGETSVPAPMRLAPAITTTSGVVSGATFLYTTIRMFNSATRDSDIFMLTTLSILYGSSVIGMVVCAVKRGISPTRNAVKGLLTYGMPLINLFNGAFIIYTMIDNQEEEVTPRNVGNVMNLLPASFGFAPFRLMPWYPAVIVIRTAGSATATVGMFMEAVERGARLQAERGASQELDETSQGEDETNQQVD